MREVLEQDADYAAAVASLKVNDLMAPTYITVAGIHPGQGIVIARSRKDTSIPSIEPDGGGRVAEVAHTYVDTSCKAKQHAAKDGTGSSDLGSDSVVRAVSDKETPLWSLAVNGHVNLKFS